MLLLKAWVEKRENALREEWVKTMEIRITREALGKCQKIEGVNHYESCKDLAVKYKDMLADAQVRSYNHSLCLWFCSQRVIGNLV